MYLDPAYLIYMVPAFLLMFITSWYVNSAYRTWSRVSAGGQVTGYQAAQRLLSAGNLQGVQIAPAPGNLSDNYDPRQKVLHLSRGVAESTSVAALAIAAHELGHAMQDQEGYLPLRFRAALVPMVNLGSYLGWILIVVGLILGLANLAWLGVIAFSGGAVFALATLPVELNASLRARRLLAETGLINGREEQRGVNTVLNAAAFTYVAALLTAVLQLFYFTGLVGGMGSRRR